MKESLEDSFLRAFSEFSGKINYEIEELDKAFYSSRQVLQPREGREPGSIFYTKSVLQHLEALARLVFHRFDESDVMTKLLVMLKLALDSIKILINESKKHLDRQKTRHQIQMNKSLAC